MPNLPVCKDCHYYAKKLDEPDLKKFGACVRYPPVLNYVWNPTQKIAEPLTRFPSVAEDWWCGDFEPKV